MADVTTDVNDRNAAGQMRPEAELLRRILRIDQLGDATSSLDVQAEHWPPLMQEALHAGLGAILYVAARRRNLLQTAPKNVVDRLRTAYASAMQRGTAQRAALVEILRSCAAAGLRVVVMKGAALSALLYQDPALRSMVDIDLLAERHSLDAVHDALVGLGYQRVQNVDNPHFSWSGSIEVGYVRESPRQVIDLHWDVLVPSFGASMHTGLFWSHVRGVEIGGQPALVFTHEAMLLHLAVHHYLHHLDDSPKRTFDAALLVHRHGAEMDWSLLRAMADEAGMASLVERMLHEVGTTWGVDVEAGQAAFAAHGAAEASAHPRIDIDMLHSPARHIAISAAMPSKRRSAEYFFRQLFPRPNYMKKRYGLRHRWQLPLYYALRLGRGLQQLGGFLLRRRETDGS